MHIAPPVLQVIYFTIRLCFALLTGAQYGMPRWNIVRCKYAVYIGSRTYADHIDPCYLSARHPSPTVTVFALPYTPVIHIQAT